MACIVYQIDKKTGAKFAYESVSYWDKEKKQPRSKRKYLGKVDPETGEIIPSRSSNAPIKISEADASEIIRLQTLVEEQELKISELTRQLKLESEKANKLSLRLREIVKLAKDCRQPSETVIKDTIPGQGKT